MIHKLHAKKTEVSASICRKNLQTKKQTNRGYFIGPSLCRCNMKSHVLAESLYAPQWFNENEDIMINSNDDIQTNKQIQQVLHKFYINRVEAAPVMTI